MIDHDGEVEIVTTVRPVHKQRTCPLQSPHMRRFSTLTVVVVADQLQARKSLQNVEKNQETTTTYTLQSDDLSWK